MFVVMWVVQKSYTWIFFALNIVNYVTPNHYHLISNVDSGRIWRINERCNVFTWIYCGGDVGGRSPQKWNRPSRKIQVKRFIKQTQKFSVKYISRAPPPCDSKNLPVATLYDLYDRCRTEHPTRKNQFWATKIIMFVKKNEGRSITQMLKKLKFYANE